MKLAENDINRIMFGYDTEEEMEQAIAAHRKAYDKKKAKEEKEEAEYEEWLRKEFF